MHQTPVLCHCNSSDRQIFVQHVSKQTALLGTDKAGLSKHVDAVVFPAAKPQPALRIMYLSPLAATTSLRIQAYLDMADEADNAQANAQQNRLQSLVLEDLAIGGIHVDHEVDWEYIDQLSSTIITQSTTQRQPFPHKTSSARSITAISSHYNALPEACCRRRLVWSRCGARNRTE